MCHYSHSEISVVASYEYPYQCILVAMRYYEILQHCYHMDVVRCLFTKRGSWSDRLVLRVATRAEGWFGSSCHYRPDGGN